MRFLITIWPCLGCFSVLSDDDSSSDRALRACANLFLTFDGALPHYRSLRLASSSRAVTPLCADNYEDRYATAFEEVKGWVLTDLKAELDWRGIEYEELLTDGAWITETASDGSETFVFDDQASRTNLAERVAEARAKDEVSPNAVDKFSKMAAENMMDGIPLIDSNMIDAFANQLGSTSLPDGLDIETVKRMANSPDIRGALMNPKMLEMVRRQMQDGDRGVEAMLAEDPEALALMKSLDLPGMEMPGEPKRKIQSKVKKRRKRPVIGDNLFPTD